MQVSRQIYVLEALDMLNETISFSINNKITVYKIDSWNKFVKDNFNNGIIISVDKGKYIGEHKSDHKYIGEVRDVHDGFSATCIRATCQKDITVIFSHGFVKNTRFDKFNIGNVSWKYKRRLKSEKDFNVYNSYNLDSDILTSLRRKFVRIEDVSLSGIDGEIYNDFSSMQDFIDFMVTLPNIKYLVKYNLQLDKNLLGGNNSTHYSRSTCCLISAKLNNALGKVGSNKLNNLPKSVVTQGKRFGCTARFSSYRDISSVYSHFKSFLENEGLCLSLGDSLYISKSSLDKKVLPLGLDFYYLSSLNDYNNLTNKQKIEIGKELYYLRYIKQNYFLFILEYECKQPYFYDDLSFAFFNYIQNIPLL